MLSLQLNYVVKPFCYKLAYHCFPTLMEYFMYSHLPNFMYFAAMLCCSEDKGFFDEDFF
jgi:hypothetical protein